MPLLGAPSRPGLSRSGRRGRRARAPQTILVLSRSRAFGAVSPERKQMQMSPQTLHRAIHSEAASPGLNSPLNSSPIAPSRGKGSASIFLHVELEGGGRRRPGPLGVGD